VEQEAERVRRCNGRVERLPAPSKAAEPEGPYRVWLKCVPQALGARFPPPTPHPRHERLSERCR